MPDENQTEIEIKLRWPLEDDTPAIFANQFSISQPGPEIVLGFGAFLPVSFSNRTEKEIRSYLDSATVDIVAKIVVSPDGLKAFYNLLKSYIENRLETEKADTQ